jgi:Holliday junction DNA helicase RuvA
MALESNSLVLDVSGVGYLVQIPAPTSRDVKEGRSLLLYTSLVVRDDGFTLFGFLTQAEQKAFELLRSVTGVGPKSALAVLSELTVEQVFDAVTEENDAVFKAVTGIGAKTAKLISVTLAGRLGVKSSINSTSRKDELSTVVSALTGLGWSERVSIEAGNSALKSLGAQAGAAALLKYSLSTLGSSKSLGAADE